jgi:GT2 family glycosyltransferase
LIDVIIPAYRGLPQTRRCLESVLGAPVRIPHEVVVIDDASPEPELSAWLRGVAAGRRITLVAHADNAGFVASVNEGMRLHADRDVVLLNSDTEVSGDWLDRLAACAARVPRAGTVTPFSNNATICSYPVFAQANPLPKGLSAARLDRAFARANAGKHVEIPTAVGFCMFIPRRCLAQVGLFDEDAFGRGYGEEVDFCMRAARAGWRNLLAADTFVYHEGEVSFGGGAQEIRNRAQAIIDARYPEFQPLVRAFLADDPPREFRDRATAELEPLAARLAAILRRWSGAAPAPRKG